MEGRKKHVTDVVRKRLSDVKKVRSTPLAETQKEESASEPAFIEKYHHDSGAIILAEELPHTLARTHHRSRKVLWGALVAGISFIVIAGLLSTVFARVTITLKPRVETIALQDISAAFDSSVSKVLIPQKVLPAEKLEFSKALVEEFDSTGTKFIEERARGKVRLYNGFSSAPQSLVESTRFLTDAGLLYRLAKTVVIPGAEISEGKIVPRFVEVELIADKAGEESNLGQGVTLRIPGFKGTAKYEGFYAVTFANVAGGFRGEAKVVSKDDLKKAQEQLTKKIYDELGAEIARKVPHDFTLIDALREIQITKVEVPRENTRRDRFPVEVKATGKVIVFREKDTIELVKSIVIKDDKKELVENSVQVNYRVRSIDYTKGKADVVLSGEAKTSAVIPEGDIVKVLAGKKEGSIIEALKSRPELASFQVAFFPPWLFKSPANSDKIRFIIQKPQ